MTKFVPYFETNNVRYTMLNGMKAFLSKNNRVIGVQVNGKVSQDPLLVRFWQNELNRRYT